MRWSSTFEVLAANATSSAGSIRTKWWFLTLTAPLPNPICLASSCQWPERIGHNPMLPIYLRKSNEKVTNFCTCHRELSSSPMPHATISREFDRDMIKCQTVQWFWIQCHFWWPYFAQKSNANRKNSKLPVWAKFLHCFRKIHLFRATEIISMYVQ